MKGSEPNSSDDKASLSYRDLAEFVEPNTEDKKLPASLELKKWLFEKRLEYARSFFDHHAKQRMSMFQFFLIFVGFAIGGYGALLKDGRSLVAMGLGIFGAALTICFLFLDRRNEELVHISEDVLESLESDPLFYGYNRPIRWKRRRTWIGSMEVQANRVRRPLGIFRRQRADQEGWDPQEHGEIGDDTTNYDQIGPSRFQHGRWMPVFQLLIFVLFVVLAAVAWCPRLSITGS